MTVLAKSESIGRTVDSPTTAVQNVAVNHGRTDILVPEQFLDRPNIIAVFQEDDRLALGERSPWDYSTSSLLSVYLTVYRP